MDGYATHLPVLAAIAKIRPGRPLEIGCGYYSTPLVQSLGGVSVETNEQWGEELQKHYNVRILHPDNLKLLVGNTFSWVFIDCAPEELRRQSVRELRSISDTFILHDCDPCWADVYKYDTLYPLFKHRFIYDKLAPQTLVLSDKEIDL